MLRRLLEICAIIYTLQLSFFVTGDRLFNVIFLLPIIFYGLYKQKGLKIYFILLLPFFFIFDSPNLSDYFFTVSKLIVCLLALYAGLVMRRYWKMLGLVMVLGVAFDLFTRMALLNYNFLYVLAGPNSYKIGEDSVFTDTNFYGIILVVVLDKFRNEGLSIPLKALVVVCLLFTASKTAWLVSVLLILSWYPILSILFGILLVPLMYNYILMDPSGATKIFYLKEFLDQDILTLGNGYVKGIYYNGHYRHQMVPLLIGVGGLAHLLLFLVYTSVEMRARIVISLLILGLSYLPIYNEYIWFILGLLGTKKNENNNILRESDTIVVSFSRQAKLI